MAMNAECFRGCVVLACLLIASIASAATRPNIVWISCEDISPRLGCYGDPNATTPNLDRFAKQGVRFTRAYTSHGVCAPSRTGIITGVWPSRLGANHMRSQATLPEHVKPFPVYLRESGYYCTNQSKTDYNFAWDPGLVWDESSHQAHWRNRKDPNQPFFAVFNLFVTHESKLWPEEHKKATQHLPESKRHDPDDMVVPALYPNTPETRADQARLADVVTVMDGQVGRILKELEEDGLADNTIVFFWSDHGDGLPRAKRWLYETGTWVPMMVRVPEGLGVKSVAGVTDDRLISLVDLGPTVLALAGVERPEGLDGAPFMATDSESSELVDRQYVYGSRDRLDERYDLVRSVRDHRYRYVRNYRTDQPYFPWLAYAENCVTMQVLRAQHAEGELPPAIAQWMADRRPFEELYDVKSDPMELRNLAGESAHWATLARLRDECDAWMLEVRDTGLIPEAILNAEAGLVGAQYDVLQGAAGVGRMEALLSVASSAAAAKEGTVGVTQLIEATGSPDAAIRWWAFTGLNNAQVSEGNGVAAMQKGLKDPVPSVRIAAARSLALAGADSASAIAVLEPLVSGDDPFVRLEAATALEELGDDGIAVLKKVGIGNREGMHLYASDLIRGAIAD